MTLEMIPEPTISTRKFLVVRWLLCLAIAATLLGFGIKTFRGDGTALNAFLFLEWEWSNERASLVENTALWIVLAMTTLGVLRPNGWLLIPAGLYLLLESVLSVEVGGKHFSGLTPIASALRFGTPLIVAWMLAGYSRDRSGREGNFADSSGRIRDDTLWWQKQSFRSGAMLLRFATALVFLSHGYEAWHHHPMFIDLVIGTGTRQLDVWFDEFQVTQVLSVIGAIDIVVGLGLVVSRNRLLLAWAAAWGLITALSRISGFGWGAYPEVLYRGTHFLVPLALLLVVWEPRVESDS